MLMYLNVELSKTVQNADLYIILCHVYVCVFIYACTGVYLCAYLKRHTAKC